MLFYNVNYQPFYATLDQSIIILSACHHDTYLENHMHTPNYKICMYICVNSEYPVGIAKLIVKQKFNMHDCAEDVQLIRCYTMQL